MRTIRIMKTCDFDAAHRLDFLPEGHKCHRLHGHTYSVEVELVGIPDANGILVDYGEINDVVSQLDHRYLNEIDGLKYPTTENVVAWIVNKMESAFKDRVLVDRVRVHESSTTWAEYRR